MAHGPSYRYVFVCGLHRTGTSLLARVIGSHPEVAAIENAPVPENEGCYLQGAIPHTARHGIPGEFATDPAQHMTEDHPLNQLETRKRLEMDWEPWFDQSKPWRVEKSPVNLTRMRLLQALYPLSQFVIVTRHPLHQAHALQKWSDRNVSELARYAVVAYEQMLKDCAYLHAAMVIRYEDLVQQPSEKACAIGRFLDLEGSFDIPTMRDGNADYHVEGESDGAMSELGYQADGTSTAMTPIVQHPLRTIREETLACLQPDPSIHD